MRKILLTFFAALLCAANVWADESGTCGTNLTWTYESGPRRLTISGSGAITSAPWTNKTWWSSSTYSVVIGSGVTSICQRAFQNSNSLSDVTIPNTVTSIDGYAFWQCRNLYTVTMANSVTSIGQYAFQNCTALRNLTLSNSLTSINTGVFYGCNNLSSVTLSNTVTSIGDYAFYQCGNLSSITILGSVTRIGSYAFSGCMELESFTVPNSVTNIGAYAFQRCSKLASISIPSSVTSIYSPVFPDCDKLATITVASDNPKYRSIDGVLYDKNATILIKCPVNKSGAFTIPSGVTRIESYACQYCTSLSSVTIPSSVTSIGQNAFGNSTSLTNIYVHKVSPLGISSDVFYNITTSSITLHVPYGTSTTYGAANIWKGFNIVEMNPYASVTPEPTSRKLPYTGLAQALINPGTVEGGTMYYSWDNATWSTTIPQATAIGDYSIYYKILADASHTDYIPANNKVVVSIKMPASITDAPTANTLTYTGSEQTLVSAGTADGGTLNYSTDNSSWNASIPSATNAGDYTVYYKVIGDANHADYTPSSNSIAVTINKADPIVTAPTAKSLTYNGSVQELINPGSTTGGTLQYFELGSVIWGTSTPTATNAGNYTVQYQVTGDDNYNGVSSISLPSVAVSITPAPLTITAEDKEVVYNEAAPAYTATYDGFVGEEDASVLTGTLTFTCPYSAGDALGDYTITPSGLSSDNYAITYETGTLSVVSPDAITLPDNEDKTALLTALNGSTLEITIGRTIVAGPYNTFCLPFSLSAEEIVASPLAGAILKDYNGADVSGTGAERDLNIYLSDLTEITADQPFLIKTESNIVNPTFTSVTISYTAAMGSMVEREHVDFQGILAPYDLAAYSNSSPDYLGIGMDGRLYWADASLSTAPMRGFRAFFHVKDAGAANSPVRRGMHAQFVENSPKTPTGVDQITNDQSPITNKIIRDGHLIIIRGDKEYNANGMKMK